MSRRKVLLDLALALPELADEQDACVTRLTELLQAEGFERAHVIRQNDTTRLCLHYNPDRFSVGRMRKLVQAAGVLIAKRYRHETLRVDDSEHPGCATAIEWALGRMKGVLEASVDYGEGWLRLELDTDVTSLDAVVQHIQALGWAVIGDENGFR